MKKIYYAYILTAGAVIFPLLAERILMFPLIERKLSASGYVDAFGLWSWGYSLLLLVGLTITQGASYCILRYFSNATTVEKHDIFNFAMARFYKFALPSLLVCVAFIVIDRGVLKIFDILPLFVLSIFLSAYQSYSLSFTALFRVHGNFFDMFIACVAPAVIVAFSCIVLMLNDVDVDVIFFMWVMLIGGFFSSVVGIYFTFKARRKIFSNPEDLLSNEKNKINLNRESFYASMIYLGDHGVNYIPRIALGIFSDMYSVGVFVAAMSIASLILAPISLASNVIMSVLSAKKSADFSNQKKIKYYFVSFLAGSLAALATFFVFQYGIKILYPTMAEICKPLAMPLSLSAFAMTIITLVRPLVLKWVGVEKVLVFSMLVLLFSVAASVLYCGGGLLSSIWVYSATVIGLMVVWFTASIKVDNA